MVDVGHEGEASQFAEVDADASGIRAGVRRLGLVMADCMLMAVD